LAGNYVGNQPAVNVPAQSPPPPFDWKLLFDRVIAGGSPTVDFTGLTGYAAYRFLLSSVCPATDAAQLAIRISFDNGVSWRADAAYDVAISGWDTSGVAVVSHAVNAVNGLLVAGNQSNDAANGLNGEILTNGPEAPRFAMTINAQTYSTTGRFSHCNGMNCYRNAGVMNAFRFFYAPGNFGHGRILVYGIRGA
jgi:hypothetical protein